MWESIKRADELKRELDALRPIGKEQELKIQQKFKLDWNYHSNHLEGNSLTYGETKALILFNITAQGKPLKDHIEMTGHDEAIKQIYDIVNREYPLTERFIRELHSLLLKESYYVDAITLEGNPTRKKVEIGTYKTIPNHVKTIIGEIFRFATPEETPALMHDLIDWYRLKKEDEEIHPVLIAAEFHYQFIRIHPFDDGNGRTARILMNFILMQYGYPPVVIKTEDKNNYFAVLRLADAVDIEPFIKYISNNLIHSLEIMLKGARGEEVEDDDDLDKELRLFNQRMRSLDEEVILKSPEAIKRVCNENLCDLISEYEKVNKSFIDYYAEVMIDLRCKYNESKYSSYKKIDISKVIQEHIELNELHFIEVHYNFNTFVKKALLEFSHSSYLEIKFKDTYYEIVVECDEKSVVKKSYAVKLTNKEIKQIVKDIAKRHMDYIKSKIELK